jgi:signal transduction histidine kinase
VIDVAQFRSALLNLVINARDAMPQNREVKGGDGRVCEVRIAVETVDVAVEKSLAAGRYVRVQVSDTGTGIAPADLAHVFEPFFTTKDFGHGSGLGLAQVHGFAHQSGGSVSIESRLGGGTVVVMLLPAAPVEQMPG